MQCIRSEEPTSYISPFLLQIISFNQPGAGEFHGCPFRHLGLDLLSQRLAVCGKVSFDQVEAVVKRAKDKQYQLACREFFKVCYL